MRDLDLKRVAAVRRFLDLTATADEHTMSYPHRVDTEEDACVVLKSEASAYPRSFGSM